MRGGGIQREVRLFAVSRNFVERFHVETTFDDQYKDATLWVWLQLGVHQGNSAEVRLALKDAEGVVVPGVPSKVVVLAGAREVKVPLAIQAPKKWDAEHPYLYTLEVHIMEGSSVVQTVQKKVGFREVKRVDDQLFVNGNEVKFRGLWEEIMPVLCWR